MALCSNSPVLTTSWIISICLQLLCLHKTVICKSIDKEIVNAAPKAEMFDVFHMMPNGEIMVMTELDLLLTLEQYKFLYSSPSTLREKRRAVRDATTRWTNCKVYYEITESLNSTENRNVIKQAMDEWTKYTCLEFIESNTTPRRIQFKDGGGCYSQLGMQKKPQPLVLAPGCRTKGIVSHEIGHAIGWYHEHMRPDRDDFIRINFDTIPELYKPNFVKYNNTVINNYDVPYDYSSIMHYGNDALPGSITTLDPTYQEKIGQREGLTFKDIKLANVMYECSYVMGCQPQQCKYGGFVLYKSFKRENKCSCWCDSGNVNDPLILCSRLDKDPPRPDVRPVVLPIEITCYDMRENCEDMKLQDSDVCMNKMKLMMASCAKTCNFCGMSKEMCMDHEKGCPILAASGACIDEGLRPVMRKLCRASCGLCPPTNPCEIQQELMGSSPARNGGNRMATSAMLSYILVLSAVIVQMVAVRSLNYEYVYVYNK